jgi:hypothetical protein
MARLGAPRVYNDPTDEPPPVATPARVHASIIDENTPQDSQFREGGKQGGRSGGSIASYRPGNAQVTGGGPVGAAGVKQYHVFDPRTAFVLDNEPKPVPLPNVTQAVRRSAFQPLQVAHHQFTINPAWGRNNGQFPRFSLIGLIAQVAKGPDTAKTNFGVQGQRPRQRFTKVLRNPRNDLTPETYGTDGGYNP